MPKVKVTILVDDLNGYIEGFKVSFGFSTLIQFKELNILFDVGDAVEPFLSNLKFYGISPSEIDAVILSHNHYDHTNGLPAILKENDKIPIYIHKNWNLPASFRGLDFPNKNLVIVKEARKLNEISSNIYITNSHRSHDYGGIYEHACFIETNDAVLLICGCCHPGLINFLNDRTFLDIPVNKNKPLHILGGMHGFEFSDFEAKSLFPIIESITLCHCTMNIKTFKYQFGNKCQIGVLGKTILFNSNTE
jgi:7,8-dihydropterin-6-yl-methyl-4-(beta-D-ribofuranosyl)aminobenzene 5'-phosphate synthase